MKRRNFIKAGALFMPAYMAGISGIIRAGSAPSLNVAGTARVGTLSRPAAGGGGAGFTFVNKNHSVSAAVSPTASVQLTGVSAGNLIVFASKCEGTGIGAITGVSDGTSSLSVATETVGAGGDLHWVFAYILSSVASGTVTYTITRAAPEAAFFWTFVMEFDVSGTPTFDAENGASGNSTAVNSGNITTGASNCVAIGGYGHYASTTITGMQIGGTNKDGSEPDTPGVSESAMWYRILSSVMTNGAATGTIGSNQWVCRIISIKAT